MSNELLYQIALTQVPQIGDAYAKLLIQHFESAQAVFQASKRQLECIEGIGTIRAQQIKQFKDFEQCEKEVEFIKKNKIEPLFISSERYPKRLLHCADSPILLYYKGTADLNASKIISVVGTRQPTAYGSLLCHQFIDALATFDVTIVSGLAYGIDATAHRSALQHQLPTVAVLGHGLDRIYPAAHRALASQIIQQGGLLTDYISGSLAHPQNFPKRNRITAALCDAVIVIESGIKGGSLITASIANGYHKDVFAFPGKTTDVKSQGCNYLIQNHQAGLITDASDFIHLMNWSSNRTSIQQGELFATLNEIEKKIVDKMDSSQSIHIDQLLQHADLPYSKTAGILLQLEMKKVIQLLPGNRYKLLKIN
jgi:DNA processing protein